MLLSSAARLADGLVGLQTLIAPDAAAAAAAARPASGYVATRTLKASPRAVGCPGGGEGDGEREEEEEGGCWVMYGWRRRLRRLPPTIPSLRRAGNAPWALARARTADGRLVISTEPAPPRGRVVATKAEGRLVLDLVERSDSPPPPPPPRRRSCFSIAHQEPVSPAAAAATDDDDDGVEEASAAERAAARRVIPIIAGAPAPAMLSAVGYAFSPPLSLHPAVAPLPPLVCSEGCYEDVIRASSSLPKMPLILPRMVH
uniref:FAF domain-containing protein n=1 Tax=Oryza meridionalis TaxID=40149 RepID=A0A0E0DZA1_9ORYZ